MKILILQLARLGDIYMSWPAMRALRRKYPEAQIHLLTRPRFEAAVEGLTAIDRHVSLPAAQILEPLVQQDADIKKSLAKLSDCLSPLKQENYDLVINLTFSPLSSYITHFIAGPSAKVSGYTRFDDGYFRPADEISSYFYAQVGINKPNRIHVADIFASIMDVEYIEEDWAAPQIRELNVSLPENYLVLHVGASEKHKSLNAEEWAEALQIIASEAPGRAVVLIGSDSEVIQAEQIASAVSSISVFNLVGKTKVSDLFAILKKADMLIGCDSAPIHMASLTDTPTLNVSVGNVNYWETGPKASLGFILRITNEDHRGEKVGQVVIDLLSGIVSEGLIVRGAGLVSYTKEDESSAQLFQWKLIEAIYLGAAYPMAEKIDFIEAAMKLTDVNNFIIDQIGLISKIGLAKVAPLIEQGEEIIKTISRIVPEMSPLINWYHAEKIRIAPGNQEEVRLATLEVHQRFHQHLRAYTPGEDIYKEEGLDGTV